MKKLVIVFGCVFSVLMMTGCTDSTEKLIDDTQLIEKDESTGDDETEEHVFDE